jgi:SAM-dependent methyltransferase
MKADHVDFRKMDILNCDLPDNEFDFSYSVGVLHHTGDPMRGFRHLARVTRPGGVVIVSLYSEYSRRILRTKQQTCRLLGGDDIDKRVEWGEKLFGGTLNKLDKRYHGLNTKQIAYDIFGFPHESLHTAQEVLRWFDENNLEYKGAFAPLRIRDYFYAFSLPEYATFRSTFSGFPVMRFVADGMDRLSKRFYGHQETVRQFPRPGPLSLWLSQLSWIPFGLRFNCFTMAAVKRD